MADVFISYAREDRESAKRLADAIESRGWTVWWDRRIPAGKSYEDVIERELDTAACVIVLWTRTSIASEWVRNEAAEGAGRKVLIPIRLEDVRLPLAFRHLQADDLLNWTSDELQDCLASVESMIGAPTSRASQPPEVMPIEEKSTSQSRLLEEPVIEPIVASAPANDERHVVEPISSAAVAPARSPILRILVIGWVVIVPILIVLYLFFAAVPHLPKTEKTDDAAAGTDTSTATTEAAVDTAKSTDTSLTTTETAAVDATPTWSKEPVSIVGTTTGQNATTSTSPTIVHVLTNVIDLQTTAGTITFELFPDTAPNHVNNFVGVASSKGFDGAPFYFIAERGIQAGYGSTNDVQQEPNGILCTRGTVMGTARPNGADAGTEFFIAARAIELDWQKNTVFGHVIAGMDTVDRIASAPADTNGHPVTPITITRAVIRKRDSRGL